MYAIELLISTMDYHDGKLDSLLNSVPSFVNIIIVNQVTRSEGIHESYNIRPNVICHSFFEKGLSRSRNRLLALASADLFVISDDDVVFEPGVFEKMGAIYSNYQDAAIITFQMATPEGVLRKSYSTHSFVHSMRSIARVSSCEITGRTQLVKNALVNYDEFFGLGARFPMGEEVIFLADCIKSELKLIFYPLTISVHPVESTGIYFDNKSEYVRGVVFRRIYGLWFYAIGPFFYIRKIKKIGSLSKSLSCLFSYWSGGRFGHIK